MYVQDSQEPLGFLPAHAARILRDASQTGVWEGGGSCLIPAPPLTLSVAFNKAFPLSGLGLPL